MRCGAAIRRVGGEAYLLREERRVPFPASIQPRLSAVEPEGDPLGVGAVELFTLYAPIGTAGDGLEPGDTVEFRGGWYRARRVETLCLSGAPAYHWAVLRREGGTEGSQWRA